MGLDMYLTALLDVSLSKQHELKTFFPEVDSIESVSTTIGYWRKANAIHSWFVKNVQYGQDDCRIYNVCKKRSARIRLYMYFFNRRYVLGYG